MATPTDLLIAGEWVGGGGPGLGVHEPATGAVMAEVATADQGDVDRAVAGAVAVADTLERMTAFERADLLHATADALDHRAEALAEQLARESGKPLAAEALDELAESADIFRLAAEDVKRLETSVVPSADPNKRVFTHRKPNGV